MTPQEYRSTLKRLGYTQESAAKVFGYSGREGQRWCSLKGDGPPKAVAMLVKAQEENRRLQTQVAATTLPSLLATIGMRKPNSRIASAIRSTTASFLRGLRA